MSNTTHLQNHQCLYNFTRISNDYGVPLCEPWDSLLKRSEALQGEGDIDGAIDAVTAVYDKLVRHQIRALELKSRFHLKKRNYYLAMHDAIDIIHMAPLMAVGYLLKVDVYLAQNQLHEALEVCQRALRTIPKLSCNDSYRAIQTKMNEVDAMYVDFVARLPAEILPFIFQELTQHDVFTACMLVSKTWRDRLRHCGPLWEVIEPGKGFKESRLSPVAYLQIAPHVRCCYGIDDIEPSVRSWTSVIYDGMKREVFSTLSELKIIATNQTHSKDAEILAGLNGVGKTLRKLCITIDSALSIAQIQGCCPNLHVLSYTNIDLLSVEEHPVLASKNLHSLSIITPTQDFSFHVDDVAFKGSPFPNLRRLHIGVNAYMDLSLFDYQYPLLECLSFNTDRDWLFSDELTATKSYRPVSMGLSSLSINPPDMRTLMDYLKAHQNSVEDFHLDMNYAMFSFLPQQALQGLHFGRLRRLMLTAPHPERATEVLESILRGCLRCLEELIINDFIKIPKSTFQLMASLSSLRVICINGLANPAGLAEYFATVSKTQQQQLKEVRLEEAKITDEVLDALAQLKTLQSVTIHNNLISETFTTEGLNWFFGKHALHSSLRTITLSSCKAVHLTYKIISKIQSLEKLIIPQFAAFNREELKFQKVMGERPDVAVIYI